MGDEVKPKRRYRSRARAAGAAQTRNAVLDAAQALFLARGWSGATVASIAGDADVSAETVYSIFGSKREILRELITRALRGDDPDTPLLDQAGPRTVANAPSQSRQVELFARGISRILGRVAPLMAVVRAAAETEPQMAALYAQLHAGRRRNLDMVAGALLANGPLRDRMAHEQATAIIWRLASPELFMLMTRVEGLSPDAHEAWLAVALKAQLLP